VKAPTFLDGIVVCLVGSTFTGLGLVWIRSSLERNACSKSPKIFYQQPFWWMGVGVFAGGQIINFLAMGMAPEVVLSCMGVWSMAMNTLFAYLIIGEQLNRLGVVTLIGSCLAMLMVLIGTPSSTTSVGDANGIIRALSGPPFLIMSAVVLLALAGLWLFARMRPSLGLKPVAWAITSAILSGYTVMFFKCVSMLIVDPPKTQGPPWNIPMAWVVLLEACCCGTMQFTATNFALNEKDGEALIVFPLSFTVGMLCQIMMGELVFQELDSFQGLGQILLFWGGAALLLICIVLHTEVKVAFMKKLLEDVEQDLEDEAAEIISEEPSTWRQRAATMIARRKSSVDSTDSVSSLLSGALHPEAFPESFGSRKRFYTVSIMGPVGVA